MAEAQLKTASSSSHVTFYPSGMAIPLTMALPLSAHDVGYQEDKLVASHPHNLLPAFHPCVVQLPLRRKYHVTYRLPMDRPILRLSNAIGFRINDRSSSGKLLNVHEHVKHSGLQGGKCYLIDGEYLYSHYMQVRKLCLLSLWRRINPI